MTVKAEIEFLQTLFDCAFDPEHRAHQSLNAIRKALSDNRDTGSWIQDIMNHPVHVFEDGYGLSELIRYHAPLPIEMTLVDDHLSGQKKMTMLCDIPFHRPFKVTSLIDFKLYSHNYGDQIKSAVYDMLLKIEEHLSGNRFI